MSWKWNDTQQSSPLTSTLHTSSKWLVSDNFYFIFFPLICAQVFTLSQYYIFFIYIHSERRKMPRLLSLKVTIHLYFILFFNVQLFLLLSSACFCLVLLHFDWLITFKVTKNFVSFLSHVKFNFILIMVWQLNERRKLQSLCMMDLLLIVLIVLKIFSMMILRCKKSSCMFISCTNNFWENLNRPSCSFNLWTWTE
jgi:hypothetical protein